MYPVIDESVVRKIDQAAAADPSEEIFGSEDIEADEELEYMDMYYDEYGDDFEDEDLFDSYDDEECYDDFDGQDATSL